MSLPAGTEWTSFTKFLRILDGLAVHFQDDVARSKTGIVCRAGGANALDGRAVDVGRDVELRAEIRRQVVDSETELSVLLRFRTAVFRDLAIRRGTRQP